MSDRPQPVDPTVVDLDVLASWMDGRDLGSGPIEHATPLSGGTQNLLLQFERSGERYVLRRPPVHKRENSDETMRREARVLAALAGSAVPHPALIAAESDTGVLGAAFYLMEPIAGFNPTAGLLDYHRGDPAVRRAMGFSLIDAAAALGAVDHEAVGLADFGRPDGYLERQVPRWWAQLESYGQLDGYDGPDIPHLETVSQWLEANRPEAFTPGIIHGDFHLANVLYERESSDLAAIVDWELATIGDPLLDVGLVMAFWPEDGHESAVVSVTPWDGFPTITEMIDRYADRTERDMTGIEWYGVLACFKTGIILEGTHARAASGKADVAFGDLLHATTVGLFGRAMAIIDAS